MDNQEALLYLRRQTFEQALSFKMLLYKWSRSSEVDLDLPPVIVVDPN